MRRRALILFGMADAVFGSQSAEGGIPDGFDCCEWDHVPPESRDYGYQGSEWLNEIEWPAPSNYRLKENDPIYIAEFLLLRPPIEAADRERLSIQAVMGLPVLGPQLLWLAVEAGHTSVVAALLRGGASPIGVNSHGTPSSGALLAASSRDVDSDLWIKPKPVYMRRPNENAEIHSDWSDATPLFLAVMGNHTEVVRFLLKTGRLNLTRRVSYRYSTYTYTALELAARTGHLPTLAVLTEHLNITGSGGDESPFFQVKHLLTSAAWSRDVEVVNYVLLRLGFPVASPGADRRGSLLTDEHREWALSVLRGLCSGAERPKSVASIEHFLDYLREPGRQTMLEVPDLRKALWSGMFMAVVHDQTDVYVLLAQLLAQLMHQEEDDSTYAEADNQEFKCSLRSAMLRLRRGEDPHYFANNSARFEFILESELAHAIEWDRPDIVRFLVEKGFVDPNEHTTGLDAAVTPEYYQNRPLSLLERFVVAGAYGVAAYLIEHTDPYVMGYLHKWGYWTTPLVEALTVTFDRSWTKSLVSMEEIARRLLSRGGPVSSISPPAAPDFRNGDVVIDVVRIGLARDARQLCLCWGYRGTIRPKPMLTYKNVVRLELRKEDEAWWPRLRKMPEVPPELTQSIRQSGRKKER
ncbi:hypothetical protein CPLU01_14651 [Colletotrichum plurivorum]|uniref:Ankyrin repeat protein n=1 Tax=Colletotrichum plurivorum TaxID=2175906 RepID=A0A8H6MZ28_9PEZI|nr:hypothetical protein CPLU01_14651 [Colletotrichum plurivorum]